MARDLYAYTDRTGAARVACSGCLPSRSCDARRITNPARLCSVACWLCGAPGADPAPSPNQEQDDARRADERAFAARWAADVAAGRALPAAGSLLDALTPADSGPAGHETPKPAPEVRPCGPCSQLDVFGLDLFGGLE